MLNYLIKSSICVNIIVHKKEIFVMQKVKKIVSISTIVCIGIVAFLLIGLLFNFTETIFGGYTSKVLITFGALAVGGFFAISSMNMTMKNKVLGFISLGLITGSVFLILLVNWVSIENPLYLQIMFSIGLLSVLFNVIVSSGIDLGKKYMIFQICVYVVVGVVDLLSTLMIFGAINPLPILTWYLTAIILAVVGVIILKVFAKKQTGNRIEKDIEDVNFVRITKEEYAMLVEKAKKYDELQAQAGRVEQPSQPQE